VDQNIEGPDWYCSRAYQAIVFVFLSGLVLMRNMASSIVTWGTYADGRDCVTGGHCVDWCRLLSLSVQLLL